MDIYEAFGKRRTVRSFIRGVTEEQLNRLLLAGVQAPSGSNVQPWEFIVIDEPEVIEQIAENKYRQTLKMMLDQMVLENPALIESIYSQSLGPISTERIIGQKPPPASLIRSCKSRTKAAARGFTRYGLRRPGSNLGSSPKAPTP